MSSGATRVDTDLLRQQHPIVDLISHYGIELHRSGSAFTGRCPFHTDRGRPNLTAYPNSGRWVCFRCDARGDVIDFVRQIEGLPFREAAARLSGSVDQLRRNHSAQNRATRPRRVRRAELNSGERAVLSAALELYANRLMDERSALDYMRSRGFDGPLLAQERIGYAAGGQLVPYLRWRGLPLRDARRIGLLCRDGRESMQGRIVFPECRDGQPIWAIGRALSEDLDPRYLGLRGTGRRALLGCDLASRDLRGVCIVEGPTDWLALRKWAVPGLALCGTHVSAAMLNELRRWERLYIVLDADSAGRAASMRLAEAFGERAIRVTLPHGVKDPAELAPRADGDRLFAACIRKAARAGA
jgi:DNA primase